MADIFISYKRSDADLVQALVAALEAEGISVWWDQQIQPTDEWFASILEEARHCRCLFGIWTDNSIDPRGMFIKSQDQHNYMELEHREAGPERVLGILYKGSRIPKLYADKQCVDLSSWEHGDRKHRAFQQLVKVVAGMAMPSFAKRHIEAAGAQIKTLRHDLSKAVEPLQRERDQLRENSDKLERQLHQMTEQLRKTTEERNQLQSKLDVALNTIQQFKEDAQEYVDYLKSTILQSEEQDT